MVHVVSMTASIRILKTFLFKSIKIKLFVLKCFLFFYSYVCSKTQLILDIFLFGAFLFGLEFPKKKLNLPTRLSTLNEMFSFNNTLYTFIEIMDIVS